ncbi:MAG TPA: phosphoribosylamine--glycine ligase, partial [Blastocatellia bacterium]|nr:phosphoribosylamine--glycine ligase [Blastocatellia bacterium]
MKVLVVGSGGREHALLWKLSQSPQKPELYATPGNAGIAGLAKCFSASADDPAELAELAASIGADLTIVGPEAPLVAGIAETFKSRKLKLAGPSGKAARLEGSKIFAKQFMERHQIPTARFRVAESAQMARDLREREFEFPVVVKADGLAAGKGVRIVTSAAEFESAINDFMVERIFG